MTIDIVTNVVRRTPRRKAIPIVANHHRDGWTLFYRDHGRAQRFVTGAATERQAVQRAVAWLLLLRDLRCC